MQNSNQSTVTIPTVPVEESVELIAVRQWVDSIVIGLDLCPFAAPFWHAGRVRMISTPAISEGALLEDLYDELRLLGQTNPTIIETTLVVAPKILTQFAAYNQFLDLADALLIECGWEGTFQIASFHPGYHFADCALDDPANLTNRSPYPLFHLLRESSISRVLSNHRQPEQIPARNASLLQSMSAAQRARLFGYLNTSSDD